MKSLFDEPLVAEDGSRRAALAMHALPRVDQTWVLQRLPTAQRHRLAVLLEELKALAIPADPSLVQEMLGTRTNTPPHGTSATHAPRSAGDDDERLSGNAEGDVDLLFDVLRDEPPALVAHLLDARQWPWRDHLLERFGEGRRREIEDILEALQRRQHRKPEALGRKLVEGLHARLSLAVQTPPGPAQIPHSRPERAWLGRVRGKLLGRRQGHA